MNELAEHIRYKTRWTITKYASPEDYAAGRPYDQAHIDGNLLLNAGITVALNLIGGIAATAFSNANARLGVGDSSTAESAAHSDLQAATNKAYVAMESGYPSVSSQTITFRSVFGTSAANYAWNEFVVDNGTTALNRKVSSQGTKASGQTWTLDLAITLG